jgi:DNA-binding GntR family transcriptional regulator
MPSRSRSVPAKPPRYQRVADELMHHIGTGKYAVGALLPTEMELCQQYGISRHTVREALRRLRDAGLVSSRRRVGTEVVARMPALNYRQPTNSIADLLQYAAETQLTVLRSKNVTIGAALAEQLEGDAGDIWLEVTSLRAAPGDAQPVCLTTTYVDAHLPDIETHIAQLTGPLSAMLERVYGVKIARIEQNIQAVALRAREAKLLRAEDGGPALRATRRYYDAVGTLLELSVAIHPGDRFSYVTSLVRG